MQKPKVISLIAQRKDVLDDFLKEHLSLQECLQLQKRHLAVDIALNPVNALWAIPSMTLKKSFDILDQLGWDNAKTYQQKVPLTLRTNYQKEIERLVAQEVVDFAKILDEAPNDIRDQLRREAQQEIRAYSLRQSAIGDLSASAMTYLFATMLFNDGTLNVFGLGKKLASFWAKDEAASNFFLGKSLGNAFYSIAPPEPSTFQIALATALTILGISLLSTAIAVLSIPIRRKIGLQKKSLEKLLDSIHDRWILRIAKDSDAIASYKSS